MKAVAFFVLSMVAISSYAGIQNSDVVITCMSKVRDNAAYMQSEMGCKKKLEGYMTHDIHLMEALDMAFIELRSIEMCETESGEKFTLVVEMTYEDGKCDFDKDIY